MATCPVVWATNAFPSCKVCTQGWTCGPAPLWAVVFILTASLDPTVPHFVAVPQTPETQQNTPWAAQSHDSAHLQDSLCVPLAPPSQPPPMPCCLNPPSVQQFLPRPHFFHFTPPCRDQQLLQRTGGPCFWQPRSLQPGHWEVASLCGDPAMVRCVAGHSGNYKTQLGSVPGLKPHAPGLDSYQALCLLVIRGSSFEPHKTSPGCLPLPPPGQSRCQPLCY